MTAMTPAPVDQTAAPGPDRRTALRAAVVGAGALAVSASGLATGAASAATTGTTTTTTTATATAPTVAAHPRRRHHRLSWRPPGSPSSPTTAALTHLLRRTTYGITPELLADVARAGGGGPWLEQQLAPAGIDDSAVTRALARFPLAVADPPELHATLSNGSWDSMVQVTRATLARELWSRRQLYEVMVELWSNHLNVTCPSSDVWATRAAYDRRVVRPHALGRFEDMLIASMTSPAMLLYLGGADSRGDAPNENYGRELLELHTVGIDAGYGQADVVDAARALTGLTVWRPWDEGVQAADVGTFRYHPDWHAVGPVSVLGWTHPNATADGGLDVVTSLGRYLARHPSTARSVATKLVTRFVSDRPDPALVARLAAVYLTSGTAVVPVLRALFASPEFVASAGGKTRRPAEDLLAALRALGVTPDPAATGPDGAIGDLCWLLDGLGHAPLGWHPPNGYPDVAPPWLGAGTTLGRWNMHVGLAQSWWKDGLVMPDLATRLLGTALPATRGALVDTLLARLLPGLVVDPAHRTALATFLGGEGPVGGGDTTWLLPVLVALVLDSPYWSVR